MHLIYVYTCACVIYIVLYQKGLTLSALSKMSQKYFFNGGENFFQGGRGVKGGLQI